MATTMQSTGTRDVTYDLISVAYHALQGAETYQTYIEDARSSGDNEAVTFFQEALEQNRKIASKARDMLGSRIQSGAATGNGRSR